jgi:hypothetical protein
VRVEAGSFRDPDSRVFLTGDGVFRALSASAWEDWTALKSTPLFHEMVERGSLVRTWEANGDGPAILEQECAGVLEHERVPFVSYPYEWTFGMLRDAALLHLELVERALDAGLMLKDSSPYNVQWRGGAPVYVDVGSFERLREGEPWVGYRQFCTLFLYPLMLQAYRGIPFHPWLRGAIDGIAPAEARATMSMRDLLRRGVLTHVVLHSRLERRYAAAEGREVKRELRRAGFSTELIRANVRRLRKLVERLRWRPDGSAWASYRDDNTYSEADARAKEEFVASAAGRERRGLVWDVGANDGAYARVAAQSADYVVAMDADHATVDHLYGALSAEGERRILPLVVDLCDPSPDRGWRGLERQALTRRGRPNLVLCLALVHHLAITRNVPLREVVAWLADLGATVVLEFPTPTDPMVQRLLSGKRDGAHADYSAESFERALEERFDVARRAELPSGRRILYEAHPRGG